MHCGGAAVCKTVIGGFDSHTRLHTGVWCNGSTPDFDSGGIGSNPVMSAVAVAQLAVQRIVVPPVVGSSPIGHLVNKEIQNFFQIYCGIA